MSDKVNLKTDDEKAANTKSRRNFLKVASVSAPVISTIASKPVWAGTCTLSGNMSGNTSTHDREHCFDFRGFSPGGWKENGNGNGGGMGQLQGGAYKYWTMITPNKEDKLGSYFSLDALFTMNIPNGQQDNAIKENGVMTNSLYNALLTSDRIIKQMTAALLNAYLSEEVPSALDYPYSVQTIIDIYDNYDHSSEEFLDFIDLLEASQTIN